METDLKSKDIEVRSDEVHEILSSTPNWLIRWGITTIFLVVILILIGSWIIKYPDVVQARIVLTTEDAPQHVSAQVNGKLRILVKDQSWVVNGQLLGYIEGPGEIKDLLFLDTLLIEVEPFIYSEVDSLSKKPFLKSLNLGALQGRYQDFINSTQNLHRHNNYALYKPQKEAIKERISHYTILNKQLLSQKKTFKKELIIWKDLYQKDSILYTEHVISEVDMKRSKRSYLQNLRGFQSAETNITQNYIQVALLKGQLADLKLEEKREKERLFSDIERNFEQLESDLLKWKEQYLLISPTDGIISFLEFWRENQYVSAGSPIFTIVSDAENIIGNVTLPIAGSGKVEEGQEVNIKFDNYPFNEYGQVKGNILSIAVIPSNDNYQVKVRLPNGLMSTYGKELEFKQEMMGSAEIIAEDRRLIERIFNQLRVLINGD